MDNDEDSGRSARDACTLQRQLPAGIQPLSHQVSGHVFFSEKSKTSSGILECADGTVLKACQSNKRGARELNFYKQIFADESSGHEDLQQLVPLYHGSVRLDPLPNVFIKLDDITQKYRAPCIFDVKIGRTWDPEADAATVARKLRKFPLQQTIGFIMGGMRVFDETTSSYTVLDKHYLRSLPAEEISSKAINVFMKHGSPHFHRCAVAAILSHLHHIRQWFEWQEDFSFFSSSLLIVYEGNLGIKPENCKECSLLASDVSGQNHEKGADEFHVRPKNSNSAAPQRNSSTNTSTKEKVPNKSSGKKSSRHLNIDEITAHKHFTENTCLSQLSKEGGACINERSDWSENMSKHVEIPSFSNSRNGLVKSQVPPNEYLEVNNNRNNNCSNGVSQKPKVDIADVRMIDFAHVFPARIEHNDNYLFGLKSLIRHFESIL